MSRLPLLFLSLAAVGCASTPTAIAPELPPVRAEEVRSISLDIATDTKRICPRERVKMLVVGEIGTRHQRLDHVTFESPHGTFDDEGFFYPSVNVLTNASTEIEIRARFASLVTTRRFRPTYDCIKSVGRFAAPGVRGRSGKTGIVGASGDYAGMGNAGGSGGDGGPGAPGPRLIAHATYVKTQFHEQLVALILRDENGALVDLVLAPKGQTVVIRARGGPGGDGGRGGTGGTGGTGRNGLAGPGAPGGYGGPGGLGGRGGDGGAGGTIELVYDARFPDLKDSLLLDVSGGDPGVAGEGGLSGAGGEGGRGGTSARFTGSRYSSIERTSYSDGAGGGGSWRGRQGRDGKPGEIGTREVRAGDVAASFRDLPGITPF